MKGMRKIVVLFLVLTIALGGIGAGYALWFDMLYIEGTVYTGTVDVEFSDQKSNDDPAADITAGDPAEFGTWTFGDIHNPGTWTWAGTVQPEGKEVADTTCLISTTTEIDDTLTITVDNGYPCYWGSVAFSIDNIGSIPVKIEHILLTELSYGPAGTAPTVIDIVDMPLVACTTYYVDVERGAVSTTDDIVDPDTDDFAIHLSELAYGQQIDPDESMVGHPVGDNITAIPGDIAVHVEQGAQENYHYDFTIQIKASQWNEVPD